jgi:large subunit ribosomal protein L19e
MAARILKVGKNRVWIDPERVDDVDLAISREEIRKFINEKVIRKIPIKGVSRGRARKVHEKKKIGRKSGQGSRKGSKGAKNPRKTIWMRKIRSLRTNIREMKDNHLITKETYRKLYVKAKSGDFDSISDLKRYVEINDLRRRR